MTDTFAPATIRTLAGSLIAAPFMAAGRMLVRLAESNPKVREIERLNAQSEEELMRRGLTRDGEVRRILGIFGVV